MPPAGPITLRCAWPVHGIPETAIEFDGSRLRELTEQIEVLWEPVEVPAVGFVPLSRPNVPAGGWFEAHFQWAEAEESEAR